MSNDPGALSASRRLTYHWLLFLGGVLLFIIGLVAYPLQFRAKNLATPWYIPILSTLGLSLMIVSLWRRRGVARAILLVLFALFCGFEWYTIAIAMRSPAYTGPARTGRTLPSFQAKLADGTPFTQENLEQGTTSVLLFYRGHW